MPLQIAVRLWYTCAVGNKRDVEHRMRVLILSGDSLFGLGLKEILQTQFDLEVVEWETCGEQSLDRARELGPDVVIVNETCTDCESHTLCWSLLNEQSRTRILKLNLRDNSACLYRGEKLWISGVEDLVSCIRGQTPPDAGKDVKGGL